MGRKRHRTPLRVLLNNRLVGHLVKEPGGAIEFRYDESWLTLDQPFPVSLSLPLREEAYRGEPVVAVFENLLPDSDTLRKRVAEKVGADGTDAYSLLSQIGRDCVGALQFVPDYDEAIYDTATIKGEIVSEEDIENLLNNLVQAPLGLSRDQEFRISVAGAQEKTALLSHKGRWLKPRGTTPTTHIFKTQIGTLPNGIDLSDSVENEYYCLKLMAAFGLPVNDAKIGIFGKTKALIIERFDRRRTKDGRLLRLPQEDCCQALSVPPGRKYQSEGGPGMVDILKLLKGGDTPAIDQKAFLKAQILFWLMGATDGHAKNFSLFLGPKGRFHMTPFYDVLTAQPSLDARQIERKQMKMAMSVGNSRHYAFEDIQGRHFIQTAERAGLPGAVASAPLEEISGNAEAAMKAVESQLPPDFPGDLVVSVQKGFLARLAKI
ncbi:MAG: type II toxin-antitoxin system HipA family toxin [Methylacidiphilales bacterium]|nr:type II toxin-antitoxin system HipA family toxin [Candidatus Methylacidiphilales bacterium]